LKDLLNPNTLIPSDTRDGYLGEENTIIAAERLDLKTLNAEKAAGYD